MTYTDIDVTTQELRDLGDRDLRILLSLIAAELLRREQLLRVGAPIPGLTSTATSPE